MSTFRTNSLDGAEEIGRGEAGNRPYFKRGVIQVADRSTDSRPERHG